MASSSSSSSKAPPPPEKNPPDLQGKKTASKTKATTKAGEKKAVVRRRMTQAEIESYIRYESVHIPEDIIPRVSKERLALTDLSDQGRLPVPYDKLDDYVVRIIRDINKIQSDFLKERGQIVKEYHAKGYVERDFTDDEDERAGGGAACPPPPAGRRRHRPGVAKQAGSVKKLN